MTVEKYCDINYRDYLLEIEERKYTNGNSLFSGRCTEGISFFAGWFYDVVIVISKFEKAIDDYITDNGRDKASTNKEEDLLFTVYYKDHKLEIEDKDTVSGESKYYYFGYSQDPSFWTWKKTDYISIIEAFRKKVDDKLAGIVEEPADYGLSYKGHILTVRKKKDSNKYLGTSTLLDGKWKGEGWEIEDIVNRYKTSVDRVLMEKEKMLGKTYDTVCEEWGNTCCKYVDYKNYNLTIKVRPQGKDRRAFYIGECSYYPEGKYNSKRKSFESIYYDKVVSRFQRFIDEYCTDWVVFSSFEYKGCRVFINKEKDKKFYIGYVQFHKNSIYKHIANTREEVERCCKNRIDKVVYEKEKVSKFKQDYNKVSSKLANGARKHKIQELEQLQARISAQLEELKKEKDTLTYKGVVLEYGVEEGLQESYMIGRVKNALKGTKEFYGRTVDTIRSDFEIYINELEKSHYIFNIIRPEIKNRY